MQKGALWRHLIVFDCLGRRNQTCIDRDALTEIIDRFLTLGDDVIYCLAGLGLRPLPIISNTCPRGSIWRCVFSRCVMNACVSSGISAALAIFGRVRKIIFSTQ
jgi:hypothetical protein